MTHRGSSRDRRRSTDCARNVSKIAHCSSMYPAQCTKEISKNSTSSPHRRSLRLKGISAIYESENVGSNLQQQNNAGYSSSVTNHIKVETPFVDDHVSGANDSGCNQNCSNEDSNADCDVENTDHMTLKDLWARCKAKKHKTKHSVTSTEADHKNEPHPLVKPKKEEPDLEEPLIVLKLKMSKKSIGEKKQRKCEHSSSESSVSVEGISAQTCSFSFSAGELSPNGLSTDADSCSCKSAVCLAGSVNLDVSAKLELAEDAEQNFQVIASKNISKTESLFSSSAAELEMDAVHSDSPKSSLSIKNEIMECDAWDGQSPSNDAVSSTSNFIVKDNFLEGSVELLQKGSGNSDGGEAISFIVEPLHDYSSDFMEMATQSASPVTVCEPEISLHADSPQLIYNVREVSKNDCLEKNIVYISSSSNVDFIANFNSTVMSPAKLERGVGCKPEERELTCSAATGSLCQVNEASTEYMEPWETKYSPESEEHFEGIKDASCSEISSPSSSTFSVSKMRAHCAGNLDSVSATINLCSDICNCTENNNISLEVIARDNVAYQMDHSAVLNSRKIIEADNTDISASSMVNEDHGNLTDEEPEQAMPTSSGESDLAIDCSTSYTKIHDSCDKQLVSDIWVRKNDEQSISYIGEHSAVGTDYFCCQHSCPPYAFNASHAIDDISTKTEKSLCTNVDQTLHSYNEISNLINVEGIGEVLGCCSSQTCPPCDVAVNGLQSAHDESSKAGEKLSSLIAEKNVYASADKATCLSTSIMQKVVKELKFDEGLKEDNSPKKLLSNRKTISPTSQERLCQALNGMDLYDAMKCSKNRKRLLFEKWAEKGISSSVPGCAEGYVMVGSERITKKPRNSRNGSLLPVTKGILKSPDTSSRKPCSCMKISLMHKQTQEAITFSQRQMRDFEAVALRLLKGLKSMKSIVEETLSSEAFLSAPSTLTADEIREAADNVSELEVTTNKWLSIFTRDCSRFYKIMRARENEAANIDNGVRKEQKRITFADEAGGLLCHIKVFEPRPASAIEAEGESNNR